MNVSHSTISAKDKSPTNIHLRQNWNNINWHVVEKSVNKLQVRITKAVIQNRCHKVKRLDYLLTNSYSTKLLAVRKVTQNKGKRTAGIDGKKWITPESKMLAALSLSGNRYKAQPLKRVFIDKTGKKNVP